MAYALPQCRFFTIGVLLMSAPSDELWKLTATQLAQRIRQREVSCREAMQSCLARLDAVNPRLNAVVDCRPEEALAEADAADAALHKGEATGMLHGVPVTIKINVDQQGWTTSNGVPAFKDKIAPEDSAVVANLRKAGATMLGRSNAPAFSLRWFTDNDLYGRTLNPRNAALTPGGSSGGASAAVAAGLGPIAHGNDQGGSIRYPAYACGIYGLRPSFQRVPAYNPTAPARPFLFEMMSVQGPLARSVADIRLALAAMSAPDARDPWQVPGVAPAQTTQRVALCRSAGGMKPDPEIDQALQQAARWLQAAGYQVEEVDLPHYEESVRLWFTFTITDARMQLAEVMEREGGAALRNSFALMSTRCPQPLDLDGYMAMLTERNTLRRAWSVFLQEWPLVLMPVSWRTPFAVDGDSMAPDSAAGQALLDAQGPLLATAALGLPGLTVPMPAPLDAPCGVQLLFRPWGEEAALAAAEVIEQQVGVVQVV